MRVAALLIAALLAVPASIALLRPRRAPDSPSDAPRRRLDAVWAVAPIALLAVLAAFSIAA
ncbi:MAG: hypothetical protein AB7V62_08010 [Thermoleophilia bacterium]